MLQYTYSVKLNWSTAVQIYNNFAVTLFVNIIHDMLISNCAALCDRRAFGLKRVLQPFTVKTKPLEKVKMYVDLFGSKNNQETEFSEENFEFTAAIKRRDQFFYAILRTLCPMELG